MSNKISTFNFKSQSVRVQSLNNEPYFCLSDVCLVLGVNRRSADAFRLNEKGCNNIAILTKGGKQEITFINEPNLYRVIFRSNKKEAVEFQNWVFDEVLPEIRKTGQYAIQPKQLELPKPKKRYTVELTEHEINQLAWLAFSHKQMNDLLGDLLKPLEMIGSRYTGIVHSHHYEYKRHYKECLNCIKRMIEPFKHDQDIGWTRINRHLNEPNF